MDINIILANIIGLIFLVFGLYCQFKVNKHIN